VIIQNIENCAGSMTVKTDAKKEFKLAYKYDEAKLDSDQIVN